MAEISSSQLTFCTSETSPSQLPICTSLLDLQMLDNELFIELSSHELPLCESDCHLPTSSTVCVSTVVNPIIIPINNETPVYGNVLNGKFPVNRYKLTQLMNYLLNNGSNH